MVRFTHLLGFSALAPMYRSNMLASVLQSYHSTYVQAAGLVFAQGVFGCGLPAGASAGLVAPPGAAGVPGAFGPGGGVMPLSAIAFFWKTVALARSAIATYDLPCPSARWR